MSNLSGAVSKTMNFVFADIENSTNDKLKKIASLKANIGKIANISLEEIETNENVRKSIDVKAESFLRLVESIKKYGVLENVVAELRLNKKESDYKLVCIAGHRRILAAKVAQNITKIPCLLQSYTAKGDSVGVALAENLNREDLHCLDVADGYKELIAAGWVEDDLSKHFCRDIRTVKHYLKMATWSEDVKKLFRDRTDVFSTRVIMRQFAYKKFSSEQELKSAIKSYGNAGSKGNLEKSKATSSKNNDKQTRRIALRGYLAKQNLLSQLIKDEIKKAFIALELI